MWTKPHKGPFRKTNQLYITISQMRVPQFFKSGTICSNATRNRSKSQGGE